MWRGNIVLGEVFAVSCALCWAVTSILYRHVLKQQGAPLLINAVRSAFATLFFLLIAGLLGRIGEVVSVSGPSFLGLALSAVVGMGLGDTLYFKSMERIGVSGTVPLSSIYPLLTVPFTLLVLGEEVTLMVLLGTVSIVCGVGLITSMGEKPISPRHGSKLGVALALAAAFMWSISVTIVTIAIRDMDLIVANAIRLPSVAVVLFLAIILQRRDLVSYRYEARTWVYLAFGGILGLGIGGLLFLGGLQYAGAAKAVPLSSTAPLFSTPLAHLILKEKVTWKTYLATILIVAGIYILTS